MKALTIRQPWASLLACGAKRLETRSWRTSYRGRIAIHAGAREPRWYEDYGTGWSWCVDFDRPVITEAATQRMFPAPLGAVVATAVLVDCVPMVDDMAVVDAPYLRVFAGGRLLGLRMTGVRAGGVPRDVSDQLPFGVFEPGRWAWLLGDIKPVNERCPACWGARFACPQHGRLAICECPTVPVCRRCGGAGLCDPIPARGKQGLWELEL